MCTPKCRETPGVDHKPPLSPDHWDPWPVQRDELTVDFQGKQFRGMLVAGQDVGKKPLVIIVHNFQGRKFFDDHVAEYMARLGYVGLAADLYGDAVPEEIRLWPAGESMPAMPTDGSPPVIPEKLAVFWKATFQAMMNCEGDEPSTRGLVQAWIDKGLAHSAVDETKKPAVIGYCFGGLICAECIRGGLPVGGVCGFHSVPFTGSSPLLDPMLPLMGVTRPPQVSSPNNYNTEAVCYFEHGMLDPCAPPDLLAKLIKEFTDAKVDLIVSEYAHTDHGFALPATLGGAGHLTEKADRRSTHNMLKMFREIWPDVPQTWVPKNAAGTAL